MKIIDALYKRKSTREFSNIEIEQDVMDRIKERLDGIKPFYKKGKYTVVISGYQNNLDVAPYSIGIYTDGLKESEINAGYILEQIAIYLLAIGVASCFRAKTLMFKAVNEEGMKLSISLAFGYPKEGMYRDVNDIKRLPVKKICVLKEEMNKRIENVIQCARIAPSSYNVQPWRLVVYNDRIHVFLKRKHIKSVEKYAYINIGAMLGNIAIGTDEMWIDLKYKEIQGIKEKNYGNYEYIVSIYDRSGGGSILL